jgi:hypothetical protein
MYLPVFDFLSCIAYWSQPLADCVSKGKTAPGLVFTVVITRDLLRMVQASFIVCVSFSSFNRYPFDSVVIVIID